MTNLVKGHKINLTLQSGNIWVMLAYRVTL